MIWQFAEWDVLCVGDYVVDEFLRFVYVDELYIGGKLVVHVSDGVVGYGVLFAWVRLRWWC